MFYKNDQRITISKRIITFSLGLFLHESLCENCVPPQNESPVPSSPQPSMSCKWLWSPLLGRPLGRYLALPGVVVTWEYSLFPPTPTPRFYSWKLLDPVALVTCPPGGCKAPGPQISLRKDLTFSSLLLDPALPAKVSYDGKPGKLRVDSVLETLNCFHAHSDIC